MFFDRMDVKGIYYVTNILGDMDDFLEGLTVEDWKNMTAAEWECFLDSTEIEDLVEFIHEMHVVDRKIVYDMFKFMPHEMLEDFKEAPELSHEFSKSELETIGHAVDENVSKKESFMDDEDMEFEFEFERPHNKRGHKNRKNKGRHNGKQGKKEGEHKRGHGPENKTHHNKKDKKNGRKH
jgi:hypothetical protein